MGLSKERYDELTRAETGVLVDVALEELQSSVEERVAHTKALQASLRTVVASG